MAKNIKNKTAEAIAYKAIGNLYEMRDLGEDPGHEMADGEILTLALDLLRLSLTKEGRTPEEAESVVELLHTAYCNIPKWYY